MFQPPPQWLNVVTKMDGYIKYETPSKEFLARAAEVYKWNLFRLRKTKRDLLILCKSLLKTNKGNDTSFVCI
mgnify:CR=1 FL=1